MVFLDNRKGNIVRLFMGMLIILTLVSCSSDRSQESAQAADAGAKPAPQTVPVAVKKVEVGEASSIYATTASLEAEQRADILARTSGVVRKIHFEEGDLVEEGQVILELEDEDQKLNLKMMTIKQRNLEKEYTRLEKVHAQGILSPQDFEVIENRLEESKADVERAELTLSYTKVRAPFSGRLVRRYLDQGAHVQPGTSLFQIMDTTPLLARIHIPANRMGSVRVGQIVDLKIDSNNAQLEGHLRLVSPIVDATTGTVKVTAEISQYPEGTRPGDFAQVSIVTERHQDAMLVQSVAVFEDKGEQILYVAENGKAVRKAVKVGFVERGVTEILSGVQTTDLVVVKGQRNLREGMPVEILEGLDKNPAAATASTAGGGAL